jgi:BASS family bile acid:Na+ symporter
VLHSRSTAKKFVEIAKNPKGVAVGFVSQFIMLPALTYLLILVIEPMEGLALGMILVAACPGGNVSNFFSQQAKGNVALSISLTAIATLGAVFLTPFNFELWSNLYTQDSMNQDIKLEFWKLFQTVLALLVIPLFLGLWFSKKYKRTTAFIAKPIRIISFLILMGFIAMAFLNNLEVFQEYYQHIIYIVLIHNALALFSGFMFARLWRLPKGDQRTISIETGIQNSGLALVIIFTLFKGNGGMALMAAWWGIWHILSGFVIAAIYSRLSLKSSVCMMQRFFYRALRNYVRFSMMLFYRRWQNCPS